VVASAALTHAGWWAVCAIALGGVALAFVIQQFSRDARPRA
jgi:hypothetical protein